ncbi:G-type lectin S-receptor-like serine/threonine-protein kinase At1g61500 [Eucalyptus grandis]|uniref:G-type lectin S-receptor-like serine/threonine-protein kinase At1g61500 n=1 Tax=Eucalyptus grandis TaxID=71139 RepID=UPI00192E7AB3|nr:G-type lectin S-receptor-like serine/threonine-protein kinase At1g61500 [Eucalyptus grandis]
MTIPRLFTSEELLRDTAWKDQMKEDDTSNLVVYDFDSIRLATDNFNVKNKLGQGGFGPVYKGKLNDGKEIAAKRLSSSSSQGIAEFKNEILLISKLQHRNLVRLLGCCIEEEEKILVYEYLPNKSLDTFLFDSKEKAKLSWSVRFHIIQGVARGLLYLHHDSCLRVIHRDLKVSNILLDEKMNPKISDFGLSRMFEGTQVLVNTHKVVGTLFGVLLLEIISSKKNTSSDYPGQHLNLLAYAWHLWCEDRVLDLRDEGIANAFLVSEVMRCIQLGLLYTQDHATDRPNMLAVVLMLNGESNLSQPKQPTYAFSRSLAHGVPSQEERIRSMNTITITTLSGRTVLSGHGRTRVQNIYSAASPSSFAQLLKDTTDELAESAASDGSGKRFAVKDTDISSSKPLYTLAQCTPDLTSVECKAFLQGAIKNLPIDKEGGRVLAPSYNVRSELYQFYNETVFHEAPAPAPTLASPPAAIVAAPPSSTVRSKGAGVMSSGVLCTAGVVFFLFPF